jgi:putative cardiolipin synthase
MHNKVFAADNQLAVVGGRNIADNYFGMHAKQNFRDLDLLVRGPVVREVSSNFDLYWNSQWAVPVQAFAWRGRSEQRLLALRKELKLFFDEKKDPSLQQLDQDGAATAVLRGVTSRMIQAPVIVVADVPEKFSGAGKPLVAEALDRLANQSRKEILIENAYFVPAERSFATMQQRLGDGVAIRALTNSLATNNVLSAHAGYAKYRKPLLRSGIELHELRPYSGGAGSSSPPSRGPRAVLHTKAVVFDRQRVFVGTFNLDPRSTELNTENGLLVENPVVAAEIARFIEQGMHDRSWRVTLGRPGEPTNSGGKRRLFWSTEDPAKPESTSREPEASFVSRLLMCLVSWLPVDGFL